MIIHVKKGVVFKIAEDNKLRLKARRLHHDVYLEMGYIKQPYPKRIIPNENDNISIYIIATKGNSLLGTVRIIPTNSPLIAFKYWQDKLYSKSQNLLRIINKEKSAELGALAVKREFRGERISWGLYKACWLVALFEQIDWYLTSMDKIALKSLEKTGWRVEKIGPPLYYIGSMTIPGVIQVRKQLLEVYNRNYTYYKYLVY